MFLTGKEVHLHLVNKPVNRSTELNSITGNDENEYQGPVVQSVVSLTSSLRVISLTVLADLIHNILKFFAEKM